MSVPTGTYTDAGILKAAVPNSSGGTYLTSSKRWVRAKHELVSPDGTRVVYSKSDPSHAEVHVFDVASGKDQVAYSGTQIFPLGFQADGIYLAPAVIARSGAFTKLYRLDPAGGEPQLVSGSDSHLANGWVLVADGAAWGFERTDLGCCAYSYALLRLDLATSQVTTWVEGDAKFSTPQGVDDKHRLYAASDSGPMWRIDAPGHKVEIPLPFTHTPGPAFVVADSIGAWFTGQGGVWLNVDGHEPQMFRVATNKTVTPAGPCS